MILFLLAVTFSAPALHAEILSEDMLKIRDPFKRPAIIVSKENARTELEMFPVDQFKMMGVITGPDRVKAMLAAPNGKTYFVSERMKIGVRNGMILKITPEGVKIREKIINVIGQEEPVDRELKLEEKNQQAM